MMDYYSHYLIFSYVVGFGYYFEAWRKDPDMKNTVYFISWLLSPITLPICFGSYLNMKMNDEI